MTCDGYFGSVAAVQSVRNPVSLTAKLLELQHDPPSDGRIPPRCVILYMCCFFLTIISVVAYEVSTVDVYDLGETLTSRVIQYISTPL